MGHFTLVRQAVQRVVRFGHKAISCLASKTGRDGVLVPVLEQMATQQLSPDSRALMFQCNNLRIQLRDRSRKKANFDEYNA